MKFILFMCSVLLSSQIAFADNTPKTVHDMPEEAFTSLNQYFADYRNCMSNTPLPVPQSRQQAQNDANLLMQSCNDILVDAEALMAEHEVSEGLARGLTNSLRSRAARQLMAGVMNTLASQTASQASDTID